MESLGYDSPSEDEIEIMGMGHDGADILSFEGIEDSIQDLFLQMQDLMDQKPSPRIKDPAFYGRPASRKTARIPDPWQIQLRMPSPCRFFLRINITAI